MADAPIPKPTDEQLVTPAALQQAQWASYRNTLAFSGLRDPSTIWQSLVMEDSRAIPLMRELELKDDDVSTALDELKYSVTERTWTIDTPTGDDSQAALDAKIGMQQQLAGIDMDSVLDSMLDATGYGFSVAELMFDASEGQARLLSIDDAPQELFLFGNRYTPQIGQIQLLSSPYDMQGTLVPEEKFLTFTYRGRSRNRFGDPMLRRAFWLSWFKRQILAMWLGFAGKGPGTAVVRYQDEASPAERSQAVAIAEALIESTAIGVPMNFEYDKELLTIARSMDPAIYKSLYTEMQYAIARLIKGETLTSFGNEGGKGSRAQGETHQDTFDKRSISLAKRAARAFNMQVLRPLHLWNFGPNVPQPIFSFDIEQEDDLTAKSVLWKNLQSLGLQISQNYTREVFKMPAIGEGDIALTPNAAAAPIAPPSAAFTETGDLVDQQYAEFDRLTAQLRKDAVELLGERTDEIVDAARQGR